VSHVSGRFRWALRRLFGRRSRDAHRRSLENRVRGIQDDGIVRSETGRHFDRAPEVSALDNALESNSTLRSSPSSPTRYGSIGLILGAREIVAHAAEEIEDESRTASLYTALLDEQFSSSGPRYKPRTVSSFVERRWPESMIDRFGLFRAGQLARFSPCSV
jgi:hypothetical protein